MNAYSVPQTYLMSEKVTSTIARMSLERPRRLIPDVAREPVEVLLHGRAIGLGLVDAVAEALEHRQLHRDAVVAQALVQLEGIRDRHARVLIAVLDQRRR